MAKAYFANQPYEMTPVDEIIIAELPTISDKDRQEREEVIRTWGDMLGCSKRRCEQLAYLYA
jgi:hypothetical protein